MTQSDSRRGAARRAVPHTSVPALACAAFSAALLWSAFAWAGGEPGAVRGWNEIVVRTALADRADPLVQSRTAALAHAAIADALEWVERDANLHRRWRKYRQASPQAAVAFAAHRVLTTLHPAQAASIDAALDESLTQLPAGAARSKGELFGVVAAERWLNRRSRDGWDRTVEYDLTAPFPVWQPAPGATPLRPQWGSVKPWLIRRAQQFRSAPPPPFDDVSFASAYHEVYELGAATSALRTPQQLEVARFFVAPGIPVWNQAARQLAALSSLSEPEQARLFALLNMAGADALIACWETKFHYRLLRPNTAITSGSLLFANLPSDATWTSAVPTPPFPAYPSGHGCYAGAAETVLEEYFGSGEIPELVLTSVSLPGVELSYRRLRDLTTDISNARIWGGIHWRFDQTAGEKLGREVGRAAIARSRK